MTAACVHGLGTVGLPLAAVVAHSREVLGVETSTVQRERIATDPLSGEPGLRTALDQALGAGRLRIASSPEPAAIHVICVPTPLAGTRADLGQLHAAVDALSPVLRPDDLVIVESTVPPGTVAALAERLPLVLWAAAPERILPGRALQELRSVSRVVGGHTPSATERAVAFYRSLGVQVHPTDARTATVAKLAENAARDVQIALANELSVLAQAAGVDPAAALELATTHPRVQLLQPGIGVGGHCIPVDPWFLVQVAPELARLLPAARAVNDQAVARSLTAIRSRADALPDPLIALLGAAYKPGTGDLRNSPALAIARALHAEGRRIVVADPRVDPIPDLPWAAVGPALEGADLAVLLVAHPELCAAARGRPVLDLCGGLR